MTGLNRYTDPIIYCFFYLVYPALNHFHYIHIPERLIHLYLNTYQDFIKTNPKKTHIDSPNQYS